MSSEPLGRTLKKCSFSMVHVLILHTSSSQRSARPTALVLIFREHSLTSTSSLHATILLALFPLSPLAHASSFFYGISLHSVLPHILHCNSKSCSLLTLMLLIWLKSPQIMYHFLFAMGFLNTSPRRFSSFTCSPASLATSSSSTLPLLSQLAGTFS